MKYYIIAGEASGDLHGSNLMKGIYAEDPQAEIRFWGGDLMHAVWAGSQNNPSQEGLVKHYKEGAVMGFVEVLAKAGKLLKNVKFCKEDILAWKPDVVVLIDYPGFNFKIAEFLLYSSKSLGLTRKPHQEAQGICRQALHRIPFRETILRCQRCGIHIQGQPSRGRSGRLPCHAGNPSGLPGAHRT